MGTYNPMQKELRHCLLKVSDIFLFSPPHHRHHHFNVVLAPKSIAKSFTLNIEKGGIDRIECNFVENEGKKTDYN